MPLNGRLVIGAVAFCLALSGIAVSSFCLYAMIGEINGAGPPECRESMLFFTPGKVLRLFRRYKAIRPTGGLGRWSVIAFAWAAGMMAVTALLLFTAAG